MMRWQDLGSGTPNRGRPLNADPQPLRLILLHERAKILRTMDDPRAQETARSYEREIASRIVAEAQRERRQWARERHGWQPIPCGGE